MVVVCLDRVLLGRHYPSDVVGGVLLGMGMVALGLAVYSPLPRSHAELLPALPEAFPSDRNLAVVLNPSKVEDVDAFRVIVNSMAADAGWGLPVWHYTTIEDPGTGMAEAAAVASADLVLVCGGDGTVREVCAELAGTGIPIGIIPAGTGNLLARNLDIPLFLRAAIDIGAHRPGPGHRHGQGERRRHRGHPLHGDGRHGVRRRDHGGRQRGDQGEGRLARLRPVGAEVADVPGGEDRALGRRRRVHHAPGPDHRGRQRRLPPGRDAAAARRVHRRRRARRRAPAPAASSCPGSRSRSGCWPSARAPTSWSTG